MRRLLQRMIFIGAILGIFSCVDEINLSLEESNQALVIDAWVGNIQEDTYVKVFRTAPYISGASNPQYLSVPMRAVYIEKSDGGVTNFRASGTNEFRPSGIFEPQAGETYRLVVETAEGEVFESNWETMPPSVAIEDIVAEASERQVMISSGQTQFFQIRTFAEIKARISDPGVGDLGYLIETSGIEELYTSSSRDNCACTCYENRPNIYAGMNVTSNSLFQGRNFGVSLGEIPLSYIGKYYVNAKIKAVTQSNYDYLNQVDKQQRNSGSIFDPAPSRIKGNIKKQGEETQLVLGNFFLFQESTLGKVLFRTQIRKESLELNHTLEAIPAVNISCTEFYTNATTIAPTPFRP
ncbi:DUF4249 domain-containing protein [Algoriphagus sp. A40]|uniref:DUF4249 domain-containing protein n=1 Tax=Algoriphagus sp. A40 TaxID=1945863 RepID=UPI000985B3D4|nr:DUF4249 domain-containing protein [Algoriphagus sp. A40]OOG71894.1 hypothetical protein B0E43_16560 [Algoriphagus sp. A40]